MSVQLGPTLFVIYINDIPGHSRTHLALFADDTAVLCRFRSEWHIKSWLQQHIKLIESWLDTWRIKLNVGKTTAIRFFPRKRVLSKLTVYGQLIDWSKEVNYLGVTLDSRLTMNHHIDHIAEKVHRAKCCLHPLIGRGSGLPTHLKRYVYLTYIRPIITYAITAWGVVSLTNRKRLQTLQNKILRTIVRARFYHRNEDIARALDISSLAKFSAETSVNFFNSLLCHNNPTLQGIADYDPTLPLHKDRPRAITLIDGDF